MHWKGVFITALVDRLFVYGTLRPGADNEQARELAANARLVGRAKIRGRLFRIGRYPGMVGPAEENEWIVGDLFEGLTAGMFVKLDEYEGSEYAREVAQVTLDNGGALPAYVYRYVADTDGLELISSGDWNL